MIKTVWRNEKFRYLSIGVYNTVFGYGAFAALWGLWGQSLHYIFICIISHILSVANAYFGYRIVVFRSKNRDWREFARFSMVYVGIFGFNVVALPILIDGLEFHPLVAQAIIVVVAVIANYLLHKKVSFRLT